MPRSGQQSPGPLFGLLPQGVLMVWRPLWQGLSRSSHGNEGWILKSPTVLVSRVSTKHGDHSPSLFYLIMLSVKMSPTFNDTLADIGLRTKNHGTKRLEALGVGPASSLVLGRDLESKGSACGPGAATEGE